MTDLAVSFGSYVTAADVRNAVQTTIVHWSRTYLAEMARHDGQAAVTAGNPTFPDIRSYADRVDANRFAEDQLPSVVLMVPGLARPPERHGRGPMTATWRVGLAVVVGAPDTARTIRLCELYTAAIRLLLVQKGSLGGFAARTIWTLERYTEPANTSEQRTIMAGLLEFEVVTDGVATTTEGPVDPIADGSAPTGWPTVATPSMTETGYAITEELPK